MKLCVILFKPLNQSIAPMAVSETKLQQQLKNKSTYTCLGHWIHSSLFMWSPKQVFFLSDSSSGCSQCQTCPGGTESLQTAAKDCTPCRPGNSHHASLKLQAHNKYSKQGCVNIHSGDDSCFKQACTSPPIILCVKSAAVATSRSTGVKKTVIYAQRITTALWVLHLPDSVWNEAVWKGLVTECVVPSESRREPHSVSKWCVLSRGQFGSRLLHGDFLPQSRGHLWIGSGYYCSFSHWRWR